MKEKLIIRNFGPIKNVELELGRFNVLIGEQATGKSTVAKVLAAIYKTSSGETLTSGKSGMARADAYGSIEHFKRHLKVYDIDSYIDEFTFIAFQNELFSFELKNLTSNVNIDIPNDLFEKILVTFIPADRAAVNLFTQEVLFSSIGNELSLPGYFVNFGGLFSRLKTKQEWFDFSDTLGIRYKFENGQDKIEIANGKLIKMTDASSAIQTNVPLLVVLRFQSKIVQSTDQLKLTVVEEPELNCHPLLQNAILKYSVDCFASDNRKYFLTTHSPYILTSLNSLMSAFNAGKEHREEVEKIIDRKYWLNPDDVSAYMMLSDGTCEDIMDREENMIKAEKIDGVSRILNQQFDEILNIEFAGK